MSRTSLPSTAAPVGSHDASRPPATNGKAPVTPRQGAAVEGARADHETGAAASGAGIAGMAGPAGPARPESFEHARTPHLKAPGIRSAAMASPHDELWEAEPHTLAKHAILRGYLAAWFPILVAAGHRRLVYFDGFAGPGRYKGGEEGSPLIALNAARHHFAALRGVQLSFVFVEQNPKFAAWLRTEIAQLKLPTHQFKVHVVESDCETALRKLLHQLESSQRGAIPTFALLDPFGVKGLSFSLVKRLLERRLCEAFVNFMTHTAQRWHGVIPEHINRLIGDPQAATVIAASPTKAEAARALYEASLTSVARFTCCFRMRSRSNQPIYDLFFATQNDVGFERMKEAMWAVDKTGAYKLSDASDPNQTTLFTPDPGRDLAEVLSRFFSGRRVVYEEVERFVVERTIYLPSHAKKALRTLELGLSPMSGTLTVEPIKRDGSKRRGHYFADGTFMTFPAREGPTP